MQHADAKFERVQPRALRNIPFSMEERETDPDLPQAIGWAVLTILFFGLMFGFLGI